MNRGSSDDKFAIRLSLQMSTKQLDSLLSRMEREVDMPTIIPRAVYCVGLNEHPDTKTKVWVLNHKTALDEYGVLVNPENLGFISISHLVDGPTGNGELANEGRAAKIARPLRSTYFDLVCHLLKGSLFTGAIQNDINLKIAYQGLFHDVPAEADVEKEGENAETVPQNNNFLATFYTAAMKAFIANYDVPFAKIMRIVEISKYHNIKCMMGNHGRCALSLVFVV
ncbi:hypothetical protein AC249_AIPGENE22623 [Exaiptasia diaphana]|nr:hypothetical protein AC249_AIPGENE22623 [Exaiptasia diaphana]